MTNWTEFGFSRISAILPKIKLGQPELNADILIESFQKFAKEGAKVIFTPELALTGYTCEDLFHSETLIHDSEQAIKKILTASTTSVALWIVGAPVFTA